ncbi:response regulator transcription factor [Blastomonas sp. AAP53]|uniref:response regulator transcription factor n=1 Tax=Blastomonas sp. AAP53 TaxID=1248760 RepID=UPI0003084884|nr:response regulator transcription factor [Blastomonas sp. AAP53]
MRIETNPSLGGPSGANPVTCRSWLLSGPDVAASSELALVLSRFGIDAQPGLQACEAARHTPVLCDARRRAAMRAWLDDIPWRTAPLVFIGVNAPGARARLMDSGADDAVSARIAPAELAARMHTALRSHAAAQGIVRLAGFDFDTGLRQARWGGRPVPLMPREFDLLLVLARQAGMPVSRDALLRAVWRTVFDPGTNSVEVHICKLRRSLRFLEEGVRIETVRGRGYCLISRRGPRA